MCVVPGLAVGGVLPGCFVCVAVVDKHVGVDRGVVLEAVVTWLWLVELKVEFVLLWLL